MGDPVVGMVNGTEIRVTESGQFQAVVNGKIVSRPTLSSLKKAVNSIAQPLAGEVLIIDRWSRRVTPRRARLLRKERGKLIYQNYREDGTLGQEVSGDADGIKSGKYFEPNPEAMVEFEKISQAWSDLHEQEEALIKRQNEVIATLTAWSPDAK